MLIDVFLHVGTQRFHAMGIAVLPAVTHAAWLQQVGNWREE